MTHGPSQPGETALTMWQVFFSPLDCPGLYVVRAFDIVVGLTEPVPRAHAEVMPSLELARDAIPPGLYRLERSPDDHESVVETWM